MQSHKTEEEKELEVPVISVDRMDPKSNEDKSKATPGAQQGPQCTCNQDCGEGSQIVGIQQVDNEIGSMTRNLGDYRSGKEGKS